MTHPGSVDSCRLLRPGLAFAAAAMTAACGSAGPTSDAYQLRDSAGVRIVESARPSWEAGAGYTVVPEPVLHIGVVEGAEEYRFTAIAGVGMHGGTWQQGDGSIVAADFGSRQIRRYAPDGSFLHAWGARGDGPGEFQNLGILPYRGDSILAVDRGRYSFHDREGAPGRVVVLDLAELDPTGRSPVPVAITGLRLPFRDGSFLAIRSPFPIAFPGECRSSEHTLYRFTAEGRVADTIGVYRGPDDCFPERGSPLVALPFDHPFVVTTHGADAYVGSIDGFEIRRISVEDGRQTLIRATHLDLTTTEAHRDGFRENAIELARINNRDLPAVRRALLEVEYPETVPPFSQLLVDSQGMLWVRHYRQRWAGGPETWSVFAPEGHLLGTVRTPEDLQVRQIGDDFLLGIWTDELEVRHVRKYALIRP